MRGRNGLVAGVAVCLDKREVKGWKRGRERRGSKISLLLLSWVYREMNELLTEDGYGVG